MKFFTHKQLKLKLRTWLALGQWYLHFCFRMYVQKMLVSRYHSLDAYLLKWETCMEFEQPWRCNDDLYSFLGLPWVYYNPYFSLKLAATPYSSQIAMVIFENGGWWRWYYRGVTGVEITCVWCIWEVRMIESEHARVDLEFGVWSSRNWVFASSGQFYILGSLRAFFSCPWLQITCIVIWKGWRCFAQQISEL